MGVDFSNHKVFCSEANQEASRIKIVAALSDFMAASGYKHVLSEENAERSFVVGPAGRWLHVGDSFGSTDNADPDGFSEVSQALAFVRPVVDILMSDSAAIHFYLYQAGSLKDKVGNMDFPFIRFQSEETAKEYQGHPELWKDLLLDSSRIDELKNAWTQRMGWSADTILDKTAVLLGMPLELVSVGYTYDIEGVPMKWDEYLEGDVDLSNFEEFYYAREPEFSDKEN